MQLEGCVGFRTDSKANAVMCTCGLLDSRIKVVGSAMPS